MTLFQAILLGGLYWWNWSDNGIFSFGFATRHPITVSLWVGLILGDVPTAMMVGALIQPMFLSQISAGFVSTNDSTAAGIITPAIVITTGMSIDASIAVALAVGLVMCQLTNVRMAVSVIFAQMMDDAVEKRQYERLPFITFILPKLFYILLYWVPITIALYFGTESIGFFVNGLPAWLQSGLSAMGSMMPALGFAIILSSVGKKEYIPFFIGGYIFAELTGVSSLVVVMVGVCVAYLDMRWSKDDAAAIDDEEEEEEKGLVEFNRTLSSKDLNWAVVRHLFGYTTGNSFQRYQAPGVMFDMYPCLKKVYKDDAEGLNDALKRATEFYNGEDMTSCAAIGMLLSMEDQKAQGVPIEGETISEVKAALYPTSAAIGDTINWGTIMPTVLALFIPYAAKGQWWPSIAVTLLMALLCNTQAFIYMNYCYKLGIDAFQKLVQSGMMEKVMSFFATLGMFAVGGMSALLINVTTPLAINFGEGYEPFLIQTSVFDAIFPGILSFVTVWLIYKYLCKDGSTINKATLAIAVISIACGALGILA